MVGATDGSRARVSLFLRKLAAFVLSPALVSAVPVDGSAGLAVPTPAEEVSDTITLGDAPLGIAKVLEEIAPADEYFIERKLYPNADFYTGVIYKAMGLPTRMFTVLFAIGRLPGRIAHWREMSDDPTTRIGRPQQLYVGPCSRDWSR